MDESEIRRVIAKVEIERISRQKDRGTFVPESQQAYHHKWVADYIEWRKGIKKKIIYGLITVVLTAIGSIVVINYQESKHAEHGPVYPHMPDIPDIPSSP